MEDPRFVLDVHLAKLARFLRTLGFDTLWSQDYNDDQLILISLRQSRILLTRDRNLFERANPKLAHYVHPIQPSLQLKEVLLRFCLIENARSGHHFLTRCLECNTLIHTIPKSELNPISPIPKDILDRNSEFFTCPTCHRIYWKGSHYDRMKERFQTVLKSIEIYSKTPDEQSV